MYVGSSAPGCYLTFVSFELFDLSNIRFSKKIIFTCWSVLTDFATLAFASLFDFLFELFFGFSEGVATVAYVLMVFS